MDSDGFGTGRMFEQAEAFCMRISSDRKLGFCVREEEESMRTRWTYEMIPCSGKVLEIPLIITQYNSTTLHPKTSKMTITPLKHY